MKKIIFAGRQQFEMKHLIDEIKKLAEKNHQEVVDLRRQIHSNPELAFEEHETAGLVSAFLHGEGISHETGVAKTGVVALIRGRNPESRTIALRADMDALPIQEKNEVDYRSKNEGRMHACGHDVHTSCLLGAAKILHHLFKNAVHLLVFCRNV